MPRYEYRCEEGHITTSFATVANRSNPVKCVMCGKIARKIFSVPSLKTDTNNPYREFGKFGMNTSSRSAAEQQMKEDGVVIANGHDYDVVQRRLAREKRERAETLHRLEEKYAAMPWEAKTAFRQSEVDAMTPAGRSMVKHVVPD
jgi:putative FmdB family regulatory protein